jgi:hypothetical protein
MASRPDIRDVVDAFLAKTKTLAGIGGWRRDAHERSFRWVRPVEVEGELPGFDLTVKAYPRSRRLKFRIILSYGKAVWRVDYANDSPQVNSIDRPHDLDLGPITGPHYHSWESQRRIRCPQVCIMLGCCLRTSEPSRVRSVGSAARRGSSSGIKICRSCRDRTRCYDSSRDCSERHGKMAAGEPG